MQQGANLILVTRSVDKLETLTVELCTAHQIQVETWPCDLTNRGARAVLAADLAFREIHTLVNNAGFGSTDDFTDLPPEHITAEVELNAVALTELARVALPGMKQWSRRTVINIAGAGVSQSIPGFSTYVMTKAYILRLSTGLWTELHDSGVWMLAVHPGPTETDFFTTVGNGRVMQQRRSVDQVAASAFRALCHHRPYVVDGVGDTILAEATRLMSTRWASKMAGWVTSH